MQQAQWTQQGKKSHRVEQAPHRGYIGQRNTGHTGLTRHNRYTDSAENTLEIA